MKNLPVCLCVILVVFSIMGTTNAAMQIKPSDLLQFAAAGHILGFEAGSVYIASSDHMFNAEFAGTQGVKPVADQKPSGDGQAQPLGRE